MTTRNYTSHSTPIEKTGETQTLFENAGLWWNDAEIRRDADGQSVIITQ